MMPAATTPQEILREHLAKPVSLTDNEFNHFFSHLKPYSFKKGQNLITEEDEVNREYFVLNG